MVCLSLAARLTINRFEIHMEMVCCMQKQTGILLRYRKVEASLDFVCVCLCVWIIKENIGIFKENFLPGIEIWKKQKMLLKTV